MDNDIYKELESGSAKAFGIVIGILILYTCYVFYNDFMADGVNKYIKAYYSKKYPFGR